jgi:O-antigen ligase
MILSFSKSAILALIVAVIYIIVPRGTFQVVNLKKLFHVEQFRMLLIAGLVILGGLFFFRNEVYGLFAKSFQERKLYMFISERIIADSPILGVGTGQFIVNAEKLFPNFDGWQYQPVHNAFLLIWSEWGIVGLVLFILFLWKLFHVNVPRGTNSD